MLGRQLILAFGGAVVASSVTCEVDMQTDTIEVASPTSGVFRDYIPSLCGWSISTSGLIKSASQQYDMFELWRNREKIRINYYDDQLHMIRSGYAIITNLRESSPNRSIPTYSISLQGCGELATIEYATITHMLGTLTMHDVHIPFAADGNTASSTPNNHFFEYMNGAHIFGLTFAYPSCLMRLRLTYYSGVPEIHPLVIVDRYRKGEEDDISDTIFKNNILKYVNRYEVAHFGGKYINQAIVTELLLTPGYMYRLITDHDLALNYVNIQTLTLPTS